MHNSFPLNMADKTLLLIQRASKNSGNLIMEEKNTTPVQYRTPCMV